MVPVHLLEHFCEWETEGNRIYSGSFSCHKQSLPLYFLRSLKIEKVGRGKKVGLPYQAGKHWISTPHPLHSLTVTEGRFVHLISEAQLLLHWNQPGAIKYEPHPQEWDSVRPLTGDLIYSLIQKWTLSKIQSHTLQALARLPACVKLWL